MTTGEGGSDIVVGAWYIININNCCANWEREIRTLFLVGLLRRLSLVRNNVPDGRVVLTGHVVL